METKKMTMAQRRHRFMASLKDSELSQQEKQAAWKQHRAEFKEEEQHQNAAQVAAAKVHPNKEKRQEFQASLKGLSKAEKEAAWKEWKDARFLENIENKKSLILQRLDKCQNPVVKARMQAKLTFFQSLAGLPVEQQRTKFQQWQKDNATEPKTEGMNKSAGMNKEESIPEEEVSKKSQRPEETGEGQKHEDSQPLNELPFLRNLERKKGFIQNRLSNCQNPIIAAQLQAKLDFFESLSGLPLKEQRAEFQKWCKAQQQTKDTTKEAIMKWKDTRFLENLEQKKSNVQQRLEMCKNPVVKARVQEKLDFFLSLEGLPVKEQRTKFQKWRQAQQPQVNKMNPTNTKQVEEKSEGKIGSLKTFDDHEKGNIEDARFLKSVEMKKKFLRMNLSRCENSFFAAKFQRRLNFFNSLANLPAEEQRAKVHKWRDAGPRQLEGVSDAVGCNEDDGVTLKGDSQFLAKMERNKKSAEMILEICKENQVDAIQVEERLTFFNSLQTLPIKEQRVKLRLWRLGQQRKRQELQAGHQAEQQAKREAFQAQKQVQIQEFKVSLKELDGEKKHAAFYEWQDSQFLEKVEFKKKNLKLSLATCNHEWQATRLAARLNFLKSLAELPVKEQRRKIHGWRQERTKRTREGKELEVPCTGVSLDANGNSSCNESEVENPKKVAKCVDSVSVWNSAEMKAAKQVFLLSLQNLDKEQKDFMWAIWKKARYANTTLCRQLNEAATSNQAKPAEQCAKVDPVNEAKNVLEKFTLTSSYVDKEIMLEAFQDLSIEAQHMIENKRNQVKNEVDQKDDGDDFEMVDPVGEVICLP